MRLVPIKRTIVNMNLYVPAIARAFESMTGERCEVIDACIMYGKLCAECGHPGPGQCCWCLNVGNIRGRSASGLYTLLKGAYEFLPIGQPLPPGAREIPTPANAKCPPGMRCYLPDPLKQEFRAYHDIEEASNEQMLVLGSRFKRTIRELIEKNTSPEELVDAMKADRYFTGDVTAYKRNLASVAYSSVPKVSEILRRVPEVRTYEMLSRLDDMAATPLRAGEGVHHIEIEEIDLSSPTFLDRVRRLFGR